MATRTDRYGPETHRTPYGVLLAVLVPVVLVSVHALPAGARRGLVLAFGDPTVPTAFTAHFVHLSAGHLLSNLVLYALLVPTSYLLARATGSTRSFRRALLVVVLAFPPALSALSVALGRPALGYGFSGLNMALFGLLTLLLGRFLVERLAVGVDERGVSLFGLGVVLVALRSLPTTAVTLSVAGAAACLALASVVHGARNGPTTASGERPGTRVGEVELAAVAGVLFVALPLVAFGHPESVGAGLGLYVHFLGYALSYTVLYTADAAGLLD